MFGFVVSVLVTLGSWVIVAALVIARREESKRNPIEGMGAWEAVNGKAWRAMESHNSFMDTTQNWLMGLVPWSIASTIFAVVNGVFLFGG